MKVVLVIPRIFLFVSFVVLVIASGNDIEDKKSITDSDTRQFIRQSRQNGLLLQSTVDNKEYIVFQPESIAPILKLINPNSNSQNTLTNTNKMQDMNNKDGSTAVEDSERQNEFPSGIHKTQQNNQNGDGIEVPLTPEDYSTPVSGPSNNFEEEQGQDENEVVEEQQQVEEEKPVHSILSLLKRLERLERKWLRRHEIQQRHEFELELRRQQLDFIRHENLLKRREAIRQRADYEVEKLLEYRRQRRKENLNNAQIFRFMTSTVY